MAVYKNKASQKVACFAYDPTDGSAVTGDAANITAQISKDGAATAATNDTNPTELDATDAPGIYLFDLTQAESNADLIILSPVSANATIEPLIIYTEPEIRSADAVALSGDSTAADNAEAFFDGTGYAGTNNVIPTVTTATNVTTVNGLADGVITAAKIASDAIALAKLASDVKARLLASASVTKLDASALGIILGTVDDTVSPTTTQFESDDITEATADHYNGRVVIFTSGALLGQATTIEDYSLVSGRGRFVVTALTEAPANDVTFVII